MIAFDHLRGFFQRQIIGQFSSHDVRVKPDLEKMDQLRGESGFD